MSIKRATYLAYNRKEYNTTFTFLYFLGLEDTLRERDYQAGLIKKLRRLYPGCIILKNDSGYMQGIPDLTILYEDRWVALEVKARAPRGPEAFEPNQEWFLEKMNDMSYAACIFPENEKDVLRGIQQTLSSRRSTRVSVR